VTSKSGDNKQASGNTLRKAEERRRRSLFKRLLIFLFTPIVLVCGWWFLATRSVLVAKTGHPIRMTVPSHVGVLGIGRSLAASGVVRSAYAFAIAAKLNGKGGSLKAGHYRFTGTITLDSVVERLSEGPNDTVSDRSRVTIPEGFTLEQISKVLADHGIVDAKEFMKYVTDASLFSALPSEVPLPGTTLEGYLFPDTYYFLPHATVAQVVGEMLMNFNKRFYRPYQSEISAAPGGLNEVVIKGSLIEREARVAQDRPRIAGVLDNRLKKHMKLQVDAALLYGKQHKTRIMDGDLKRESPYNTYLHEGLPPGPIACPGISSLLAALHPESNDYLYYVARPSGEHIFSSNFAEHQRAIQQVKAEAATLKRR